LQLLFGGMHQNPGALLDLGLIVMLGSDFSKTFNGSFVLFCVHQLDAGFVGVNGARRVLCPTLLNCSTLRLAFVGS
jgi:hypothetical protein